MASIRVPSKATWDTSRSSTLYDTPNTVWKAPKPPKLSGNAKPLSSKARAVCGPRRAYFPSQRRQQVSALGLRASLSQLLYLALEGLRDVFLPEPRHREWQAKRQARAALQNAFADDGLQGLKGRAGATFFRLRTDGGTRAIASRRW
jgi:hypothetical protein